ncbi:MAG: DUF4388 domain-containing protein [Acidimicrobiia bacterium]|nr:DUF4388 domain-containing protein [Acidimicrobiia bacterium]
MSLQGSLDGFPLPDVLALLASTKKRGELRVAGQQGAGRIWMADGAVVGAESGSAHAPVDVLFRLLRIDTGSFTFDPNGKVPAGKPHELEPLLAEAHARLAEWAMIEAVVPSLTTSVDLADELPATKVTVTSAQWQVLRAVAGGATVADVARLLDADEFHACQAVKRLVDVGLVSVAEGQGTVVADAGDLDVADDEDVELEESDEVDDDEDARTDNTTSEDGEVESEPDPDELVSIPSHLRAARRPRHSQPEAKKETPARPSPMAIAAARRRAELAAERGEGDDLVGAAAAALTPDNANALVQELAALGTDVREASEVIRAASHAPSPAERAAALEGVLADDEGEPVNRALLVKFLSSVRS